MEDVENAVPAGAHVHLNVVRAPFDALPGRRPRVLRRDGVRPPVADDLYPMRRHLSPSSPPDFSPFAKRRRTVPALDGISSSLNCCQLRGAWAELSPVRACRV